MFIANEGKKNFEPRANYTVEPYAGCACGGDPIMNSKMTTTCNCYCGADDYYYVNQGTHGAGSKS